MKILPEADAVGTSVSPFTVEGCKNVVLETVKRGEDDDFGKVSTKSIILRLYENRGGHGVARLRM